MTPLGLRLLAVSGGRACGRAPSRRSSAPSPAELRASVNSANRASLPPLARSRPAGAARRFCALGMAEGGGVSASEWISERVGLLRMSVVESSRAPFLRSGGESELDSLEG